MLDKKEAKELLKESRSEKRRKEFAKLQKKIGEKQSLLDDFLAFLKSFQKLFSLPVSERKILTRYNKL